MTSLPISNGRPGNDQRTFHQESANAVSREAAERKKPVRDEVPSPRLFWLLFAGCWAGYGATLLLGGLPQLAEPGMLFTRSLYLVCTFLGSGPVWLCCHVLWRRHWSWPRAMCATAALCYPLGYASTLATVWVTASWEGKPQPFTILLLESFSATSPFCVLILWGGLYLGLKQYERSARVEALARTAELRALRHQLTPHFLCNTLNGISTLVGEGHAAEARRMIARLGDFLRTTLDGVGALEVSLAQEIDYVEQYVAIEQARLGDRLRLQIVVAPDALDAGVPNLLLQPLVENAIQYGVAPFPAGGEVTIRAERSQGRLLLTVRNTGGAATDGGLSMEGLAGLGLHNTAERLRVAYGTAARMVCQPTGKNSWTASIELPYHSWPRSAKTNPMV